jgi:uncharacterized protein YecE (DUF72 family)
LQKRAATGVPSFVYFNNTAGGHAALNARALQINCSAFSISGNAPA